MYDSSDSEVEGPRPLPHLKSSNQRRKDRKNRKESKKKSKLNENAQRSSHVERLISKTLMERIDETYGSRFVVRLNTQYRMNKKIAEWSNKTFYGNKLKTFPKVANMTLNDLRNENGDLVFPKIAKLRHFLMGPNRSFGLPPILFVDTPYSGEVDYDRMDSYYTDISETIEGKDYICHKSSCNIGEASLAVTYVKKLLVQDYFLEPNDIGIIAPYGAQVNLIKYLLNNQPEGKEINHLDEITVSSVDGFQGQERKVIIVSMVRNNINNSLGFLTDLRRMNVAVTRAKFHLVLIGNERCLTNSKIQEFTNFIDHFRNANSTNHFNNIFYTDLLTRMGNGTRMVYQTQIRLCVNFMQDKLKFQQVDDRLYFSEKTGKIELNNNDDYAPYKGALKDKQVREEIEEEVRQTSSSAYNQFVNTQIRKNDYVDDDTLYELIEMKKREKEDRLWRLRQRGLYDILDNRTNEDFEIQNIERKIKNQQKSQENYDKNWSQLNKKYGIYDSDDEEQMKKLKKDSKISKIQKWSDFDYHQDYVDKLYNQVIYKPVPFSREEKIRMLANHRDKEEKEDLNYKLKYGPIAEQIKKHDNMENEKGQVSAAEKERSIEKSKISIRERFLQDVKNQNQKESQEQAMDSVKIELVYKPTRSENGYSKRSSSARFSNTSGNTLNDSWSNCHVITESNSQNSLNSTRISRSSSARFPLNENELLTSSSSSSSDEIDVNLFNRTRSSKCQSRKSVSRLSSRISKASKNSNSKNDKVLPEKKIIESDIRKLSRMSATRGEACESESDSSSYVSTVISL